MNKPLVKAYAFKPIRIKQLKCNALRGVAYTGELVFDQIAIVGPDTDTAYRQACRHFGDHFDKERGQQVILIAADKFDELLRRAGIVPESAA